MGSSRNKFLRRSSLKYLERGAGVGLGVGALLVFPMTAYTLYEEAPPKRGTFFRAQVYERVEISLVEVHEKGGVFLKGL